MRARLKPPCGNLDCSVSTGIHDGLTFGSGELDHYGFWEKPCAAYARAAEAKDNIPAGGPLARERY